MTERLTGYISPAENWATRINYNPTVKGLFGMAIFGATGLALSGFEHSRLVTLLPKLAKVHLADLTWTPVYAEFAKAMGGEKPFINGLSGFGIAAIGELASKSIVWRDTYDPNDLASDGIGFAVWAAFEGVAKLMHDSGASLPVYRLLKIKTQKFG